MRRLYGFANWLVESILQQEATLRFSNKYPGQNANKVPPGFWKWVQERMKENPKWTPAIEDDNGRIMSHAQVVDLINTRVAGKPYRERPVVQEPEQPRPSEVKPEPQARSLSKEPWILAKVVNVDGLQAGEHVVLTKSGNGTDWILMTRSGATRRIPATELRTSVASIRDERNVPVMSLNPEELWAKVPATEDPVSKPEETPVAGGVNPHILDKSKLSDEQREIDEEFERMMLNPKQNHMMINALAGTGKTTILKHLAWKYGKPGQKWLYLVFNTKNRIEAKEKFPTDWVKVYTTNSFLGHVMKEKENIGIFPQTERITSLNAGDGNRKLEKARIMVESSTFNQMMTEEYHLPEWDKVKNKIPEILKDFGVRDDRGGFREAYGKKKRDKSFFQICLDTLEFITNMIRRNFQERVLTLLGLLKSFSVDPRKKDKLNDEVRRVFDKYDVASYPDGRKESGFFDTFLTDIKERIEKYSPNFQSIIKNVLNDLLHYNFMSKNYKEEVISAATWMLQKTMPKATDETFEAKRKGAKKGMVHNLGDYRDFNDDIWFPTIHADEIHFPHYDVVLADEVQDFNEGQKIMLKKLAEAGAKIVAVGDPNQAIYRFRGADNDAFNNLANMLKDASHDKEGWKPKTLSLNYRSRPEVLQYANERTHVKNLKPGKKFKEDDLAPEVTHGKVTYEESFDNIAKERSKGTLIETAYISRTNEPLVHAALKLLGKGIPFVIVGKDVSGDLVKHVDKIVREEEKARRGMNDGTPIMQFQDSLLEFEEKEVRNKSKYATQADYLSGLRDTTLAIRSCIDQFTNNGEDTKKSLGDFKKWLAERLGGNTFDFDQSDERAAEADLHAYEEKLKKEKPVILTTAHKSKGLEFARVYVLRDDQMPHPKAKHPEELAQEGNTKYVAYTRAMHQLHNLALKGQPGV
jgi:superfamily I DNA/RNA helicase